MGKRYKAIIIMNDGTKTGTLFCDSEGEARHKIAMQMQLRTCDKNGKHCTYEVAHGGLKEAYIVEWTATRKIPY